MPSRLNHSYEKRLPNLSISIENELSFHFKLACNNIILGKREDGRLIYDSASREVRLFIIDFLMKHDKKFIKQFLKEQEKIKKLEEANDEI